MSVNEEKNLGDAVVDRETEQGLTTKYERAEIANKMLIAIASCGRRFFAHEDRVSQFTIDHRGRIWFIDKYKQKRIYVQYKGNWRGFSEGGTLRALIERLRDFITQGTLLPAGIFGPWPEWVCGGDLWAYGEDMQRVRDAALRLGVVNQTVSQSQSANIRRSGVLNKRLRVVADRGYKGDGNDMNANEIKLLKDIREHFDQIGDGADDASYASRMALNFIEPLDRLLNRIDSEWEAPRDEESQS